VTASATTVPRTPAQTDTAPEGTDCEPLAAETAVAMIIAAELAAGHDGLAEVLVAIRYPNGAERAVSLPLEAVDDALEAIGVDTLDALVGRPWNVLSHPRSALRPGPQSEPQPDAQSVEPGSTERTRPPNEPGAP
jgi:hypothetical protein